MSNIQKQHFTTHNAIPRLRYSTKQLKNTWLHTLMRRTSTGINSYQPWCLHTIWDIIQQLPLELELLFGVRPRLPSLPAPDIQRVHYGESLPAERLQMLQHACQVIPQHAEQQGMKYKANFDKNTAIPIVIDAPQSGLKAFSQTLNKLLRCATTPRCATAPTWQRPLASL